MRGREARGLRGRGWEIAALSRCSRLVSGGGVI